MVVVGVVDVAGVIGVVGVVGAKSQHVATGHWHDRSLAAATPTVRPLRDR